MTSEVPNAGDFVVASSLTIPAETTLNRLNHTMLRVISPQKSLAFYKDVFGMSQTFSMNGGPFDVYYLAFASPGDEVPADILKASGSRAGLLELFHVHGSEGFPVCNGNEEGVFGFGHLGFTVPDVEALLQKAEILGYEVLKWPKDVSVKKLGLPSSVSEGSFHENFVGMYSQVGFLKDPDGYWIEVLPEKIKR